MKIELALSAGLLLTITAKSQITIVSSDMPVIGDEIVRYVDTVPLFGAGAAGAEQTWDFTMAQQHSTETTTVLDPASTPYVDAFSGSNLAMTNDGATYLYFNNASAVMTADGAAADPLGDGTIVNALFEPAVTMHSYPRQFGDALQDNYGFEVIADGGSFGVYQARLRHQGTLLDSTDAHGTVQTPVGGYAALRVKYTSYSVDSLWVKLVSFLPWTFVTAMTDSSTSYSWLAKETKLPVAEMTVDGAGNATRFTWSSLPPLSTAINAPTTLRNGMVLFPQPSSEAVRISVEGSAFLSVTVNDLDGRTMLRKARMMTNDWLDLSDLPAAVYVVNVTSESGQRFAQRLVHLSAQ